MSTSAPLACMGRHIMLAHHLLAYLPVILQITNAANDSDLESVAYEIFTQAFVLYEEEIADSKARVTAIYLIIGTLQRMNAIGVENRDTLTHKATGYSAKLLKKPDQCRAVYACSHPFRVDDQDGIMDGERVLLCLKRLEDCKCCSANGQCYKR